MLFKIGKRDVLIIVDVQNDFLPNGALPVPEGYKVVSMINDYINKFKIVNAKIYATQDWHPSNHQSFKAYGGIWPSHCIKGTKGAEFHPDLNLPEKVEVIRKGTKPSVDGYSGFDHTKLQKKLRNAAVKRIFVGDLATDYARASIPG